MDIVLYFETKQFNYGNELIRRDYFLTTCFVK